MRSRLVAAVLALSAVVMAQETPAPCPADRPVDEIIAAIQKQQSKKAARNKNPLPDNLCFAGWCRKTAKTPPIVREPAPAAETPATPSQSSSSSSKAPVNACDEAMEKSLAAAHDVEVGDYYFDDKNFKAASFRYADALQNKPDDAAIQVRLGRAYEKRDDPSRALEHYQAAVNLGQPAKWVEEARSAVERLVRGSSKKPTTWWPLPW